MTESPDTECTVDYRGHTIVCIIFRPPGYESFTAIADVRSKGAWTCWINIASAPMPTMIEAFVDVIAAGMRSIDSVVDSP